MGWCLTFVGVYISHKKHDQFSCFREVYVMVDYVDKIKIKKKCHFAYLTFISIPALSFLFVLGKRIYISLLVSEFLRSVLYFVYVHHF